MDPGGVNPDPIKFNRIVNLVFASNPFISDRCDIRILPKYRDPEHLLKLLRVREAAKEVFSSGPAA